MQEAEGGAKGKTRQGLADAMTCPLGNHLTHAVKGKGPFLSRHRSAKTQCQRRTVVRLGITSKHYVIVLHHPVVSFPDRH